MPDIPESPATMNAPDRSIAIQLYVYMHGIRIRFADEKNGNANNITHLNDFFKA